MVEETQQTPTQQQQSVSKAPAGTSHKQSEMSVSENKYVIADQKKQILQINEKLKDPNLPLDERKKYEDQRDELQNKIDAKADKNLQKNKGPEEEEMKDVFKEDDILHYMYNEWLLAGANWLFKKSYKLVDNVAQKGAGFGWEYGVAKPLSLAWDGLKYSKKKLFDKTPPRDDATTRRAAALDERQQQYTQSRDEQTDAILKQYKARLTRIHTGRETEEDKKSPLYKEYHNLNSVEERKKYIAKKMVNAVAMAADRSVAYRLAETAVALKYTQESMQNKNKKMPSEKEHQAEVKLMALLIARKIHSSNNPQKTVESFTKELNNAQEKIKKNLQKGKYDANDKKAKDNKYLNNFFTTLGLTENGNLPQNTTAEHLEQSVYQEGSEGRKIEKIIHLEDADWLNKLQESQAQESMPESLRRSQSNMAVLNNSLNSYKQGEGALLSYQNKREKENAPSLSKIDAMYKKLGIATNPYHNIQGQGPLAPEHHKVHFDVTKGAYDR